jgi:predicted RNA-binding Zn ribbon-like protein
MDTMRDAEIHMLVGGALCLDFVNTLNGHLDGPLGAPRHEYLLDYRDLVLWSRHVGILTQDEASLLLAQAGQRQGEAQLALERVVSLRETLYRIFKSIASDLPLGQADLDTLDQARLKILAQSRLVPKSDGFRIEWQGEPESLDRMLAPLILSAVELLTSNELGRLRECDGEVCDWLFVDKSRNHLRRWCSMDHCGNRAKSRRQYARRKGLSAGT